MMSDIHEILIQKWANQGVGMGYEKGGRVVFIPYSCPGDVIQFKILHGKKSYMEGRIERILQASPQRIQSICPHFGECGGCHFQHIAYGEQVRAKSQILSEIFQRPVDIIPNKQQWEYRNKATFHCLEKDSYLHLAYACSKTQKLIPIEYCYLLPPTLNHAKKLLEDILVGIHGLETVVLRINSTETQVLVNILGHYTQQDIVIKRLQNYTTIVMEFQSENQVCDFIPYFNSQKIDIPAFSTKTHLSVVLNEKQYEVGANDFFQINYCMAEKIFRDMMQYMTQHYYAVHTIAEQQKILDTITQHHNECTVSESPKSSYSTPRPFQYLWDMYCGSLTIGIQLAAYAEHIYGMEINPSAILAANKNIQRNGISNAVVYQANLATTSTNTKKDAGSCDRNLSEKEFASTKEILVEIKRLFSRELGNNRASLLILDPPREGSDICKECNTLGFQKIFYMSCDPMTAKRDMGYLSKYEIKTIQGYDMFPQTYHTETWSVLELRS